MSDEKKPNFPEQGLYAFPHSIVVPDGIGGHHYSACAGMSLRDYFAAQALVGIVSAKKGGWDGPEEDSKKAYQYADAMLAARGGK